MWKKTILKILTVAFCLTILVPLVQAQYRGSLRGVITDPQGAVLQGATVTLLNTDTNAAMTTKTDVAGIYVFNALPTANYKLTIEHTGFKKKILERVLIIPDQLNALDLRLEVGQIQEVVTVSDTILTLDTETATVGTTVTHRDIASMPSFGRDVYKLVQLAPGVMGDTAQGNSMPGTQGQGATNASDGIFKTENGPQAHAAGQQYENNSYSLDGISTTSAVWGGTTIITPTEEAVQEVKVVSHAYDAEFGRFSGTQVQVTSKSGSNQVHGSAFFTAHRPGLNAYQRWNGPWNPVYKDNEFFSQFGGSLGGPLWKDKVFGFFAWETVRSPKAQTNSADHWYETSDFAGLAPSGSLASKYLSLDGSRPNSTGINERNCASIGLTEGVNCATIAGKGLDIGSPLASALGTQDLTWSDKYHPGVGSGLDGIADIADYKTTSTKHYTKNQYVGRVDANITQKDRVAGSLYWIPVSNDDQNGDRPYDVFHHSQINNAFSLIWNRTISSTFVNEARFNAAGWRWNEVTSNPQSPAGLPHDSIQSVGDVDLAVFGPNVGSILDQWTYSYKDVATKVVGRNTIKFGGELTRLHYLNQCVGCGVPSYGFFNIWSWLNDAPNSEGWTAFDPHTGAPTSFRQDDRENLWGFFVHNDLRLRRNLTLNMGLRWSYFGPLFDKNGNMYHANPGAGSAFMTGLTVTKGDSWNAEKSNFGPQLGFSWSPDRFKDKLVVRGGYGLSYNQLEIAISANIQNNPGLSVWKYASFSTPTGSDPSVFYSMAASGDIHSWTYPANSAMKVAFGANGLPTTGSVGVGIFPGTMPTIKVHHYSLDAQYDLGHNWIASLGYQGSVSRNLLFHANPNAVAAAKGYVLNPSINGGDLWGANGYGNYNAMLAEVKHNFSHGLMLDAQFTWAKSMDTSSGPYYENPFAWEPAYDYGRSDFDVNRALKIFGSYSPTFFKGQKNWMEKALGGWTVSGIYNFHTGYPWSPIVNLGGSMYCDGCGYGWMYPGAYLGGAGHDTSTDSYKTGANFSQGGKHYFSMPTYTLYSGGTYGSSNPTPGVHRNTLVGPGYRSVDATLVKSFGLPNMPILGESAKCEFRVDAYNLFNNLNLLGGSANIENGHIINDINSSNFGKSNGAYAGRVVTLGARFNF